ncbi:MAG TPA: fasciclin domain-containing protein [Polyangiaceae bacterium]
MKMLKFISLTSLAAALALTGCGDDDNDDPSGAGATGGNAGRGGSGGSAGMSGGGGTAGAPAAQDIVTIASGNPDFESLVAAVQKANLVDTLKGPGPFTVFAPTDAAFAALLESLDVTFDELTAEQLAPILTYHVVADEVTASEVTSLNSAKTVNGADFRIRVEGGKVVLSAGNGDINVTTTDIEASNGVIHVIDKVMLPPDNIPTVAQAAGFTSLVAALQKAGLADDLAGAGPFTVFAPTNAAFSTALQSLGVTLETIDVNTLSSVLRYHVVPTKAYSEAVVGLNSVTTLLGADVSIAVTGANVRLNGSTNVTQTNVLANNGVIHVVDRVLLPPAD